MHVVIHGKRLPDSVSLPFVSAFKSKLDHHLSIFLPENPTNYLTRPFLHTDCYLPGDVPVGYELVIEVRAYMVFAGPPK